MDRYRIDRVVGKGSFGQAILCARIADGKACIVKQVDTSKLPSKARREASKEATLLAKLSHPNIVGFWESFFHGRSQDVLCIVMDYADGGDLSSCLRRRCGRLLDEDVVLDWFVQTTLALKHIHDRKILHRDLKTQNIFLTRSRVVKLGDFGIAKVLGNTRDMARTAIGTPYYMSPEICQEKRYNHKSDMWSLGCILYEMACLRHAFEGGDMRLLVMKICAHEPRPISARYSSGVRSLVAQLLKKDPHARPSTGAVLRKSLIKDKIGRFLSEAQIREEFSNGVSLGHQPSSSSAAGAAVAPSRGADGHGAPRWPFHAAGISRPRRAAASSPPGSMARGRDNDDNNAGRAIDAGARGRDAQAGGVKDWRKRAAEEADERRRAEALVSKKKEVRAVARERGQLAAVALNIAKPPSADSRRAKPKRPSSAEDAASKRQRDARLAAEGRELDSRRAQERAEAARVALGIGGRKAQPPRRASQHDGDAKAQEPRRPSARALSPTGAESSARVGGGGRSPAGGGAESVAQPGSKDREGAIGERRGRGEGVGPRPGGVVGLANLGIEMDAALELARRRRAARAIFGLGGQDDDEPNAPPVRLEDKRSSGLEVKSSRPDRPISGNVGVTPGPARRAAGKPLVPTPPREPPVEPEERLPPSESKQAANPHDDNNRPNNRTPATAAEEGDGGDGDKLGMDPVGEDAVDVAGDGCRRPGQAQQQHETVSMAVPKAPPLQAEQKGSSDDGIDASLEGRGGGGDRGGSVVHCRIGAAAVAAAEKERKPGGIIHHEAGGEQEGNPPTGCRRFLSDIPHEIGLEVGDGGGGDGEVRSKVDLGVEDGWFEKFEAKMGAIKKQVGQIKSPPFSTPQRSGGYRRDHASSSSSCSNRRDPVDATPQSFKTPPPLDAGGRDSDHNRNHHQSSGAMIDSTDEEKVGWRTDGRPCGGHPVQPQAAAKEEELLYREEAKRRWGEDEGDVDARRENDSSAAAAAVGSGGRWRRGDDASRSAALRRCNSQQMARISATAAAVEAAAAAVAAIPAASENNRTPDMRRYGSDGDLVGQQNCRHPRACDDDEGDDDRTVKRAVGSGSGSGSARARPSPLGGAGGVRVAMTPAQRGSAGRATRKPPLSSQSKRKPPRHAAALAAELERHSENRAPRMPAAGNARNPNGDGDEGGGKGDTVGTPSAEERVQALRATRDRERENLRAMIRQKRRKSSDSLKRGRGGGASGASGASSAGDEETPEDVPQEEPAAFSLHQAWSSPRDFAAAGGRPGASVRVPTASDPPPRRGERFRGTPPPSHRAGVDAGKKGGLVGRGGGDGGRGGGGGGGSVDASRRRRRPRSGDSNGRSNNNDKSDGEGKGAPNAARTGREGAPAGEREPAKRKQSLRDFIAESRRNQRTRQQFDGLGGDAEGHVSVVVAPAPRGGRGGGMLDHDAQPAAAEAVEGEGLVAAEADLPEPAAAASDGDNEDEDGEAVVAVRGRRNIGLELDEEDKAWEAGGDEDGGGGGLGRGGRRGEEREIRHAEKDVSAFELDRGSYEFNEDKGHGEGLAGKGSSSCTSTPSRSPSPSPRRRDRQANAAGAEAVGATMEGVHPGLATYDSQRSSSGMDGGGRAGLEEYARMLELMQQEVLELGDGASTDSGWGGSSSSSGEGISSGQEQRQGLDEGDDDGRPTSSGGGGGSVSPGRKSGASSVVSGPELAVFLFQGGVMGSIGGDGGGGESDVAFAFEAKEELKTSTAARSEEERNAAKSSSVFPSSQDENGLFEYSGSRCEDESAQAGLDFRAKGLNAAAGNATMAGSGGETAVDDNGREDADGGTKSSSLGGALRGVDLVSSPLNKTTEGEREADGGRDDERPLRQRRGEKTGQGGGRLTSRFHSSGDRVVATEGGPLLHHRREDDQRPSSDDSFPP